MLREYGVQIAIPLMNRALDLDKLLLTVPVRLNCPTGCMVRICGEPTSEMLAAVDKMMAVYA